MKVRSKRFREEEGMENHFSHDFSFFSFFSFFSLFPLVFQSNKKSKQVTKKLIFFISLKHSIPFPHLDKSPRNPIFHFKFRSLQ